MMFIKLPSEDRTDAMSPLFLPYSVVMNSISVLCPLLKNGTAKKTASIRQAIPLPSVNHHALIP